MIGEKCKYTSRLYFRRKDFTELTDFLDEKEIFWSHENVSGNGAPPDDLLELIAPVDELSCLSLSAKRDLVDEMVSMFGGDTQKSLLEALLVGLVRLDIFVGLALNEQNQSRKWLEWFSYGGHFGKMIELFSASWSSAAEVFPAFGVLIVTKPILSESQSKLIFDRPKEPS